MKKQFKTKRQRIDWLKLPVHFLNDERIAELIAQKGVAGLGIYITLITQMHSRQSRSLTEAQIKLLRLKGATLKSVMQVVNEFGLFSRNRYGHIFSTLDFLGFDDDFSAQPLSETMDDETEIETENESENGAENGFDSESDSNQIAIRSQSDAFPTPARINTDIDKDNILLEGEAGADHPAEGEGQAADQPAAMTSEQRAAACIQQLPVHSVWAEVTMLKSGFGSLLQRHWSLALEEFTKHVLVNRTVESIHDVECAKQYFYRYATNPVAGAMLRRALEEQERDQRATSTFCHEDADSAPGHRSYHGIPLPDDAPPRPDQQSEWDFESHSWVSCRA